MTIEQLTVVNDVLETALLAEEDVQKQIAIFTLLEEVKDRIFNHPSKLVTV